MKSHIPQRLTGAALLLALALTLLVAPAPAGAAEHVDPWNEATVEQTVQPQADDDATFFAWLVDTWNQLRVVVFSGIRAEGGGPDGGDRGSGMDPNGHDHQMFQK